jgi:hypothetical protein
MEAVLATLVTRHIALLFDEASRIARLLDGVEVTDDNEGLPPMENSLERISNLVSHALEELRDEHLRARDGWPSV